MRSFAVFRKHVIWRNFTLLSRWTCSSTNTPVPDQRVRLGHTPQSVPRPLFCVTVAGTSHISVQFLPRGHNVFNNLFVVPPPWDPAGAPMSVSPFFQNVLWLLSSVVSF